MSAQRHRRPARWAAGVDGHGARLPSWPGRGPNLPPVRVRPLACPLYISPYPTRPEDNPSGWGYYRLVQPMRAAGAQVVRKLGPRPDGTLHVGSPTVLPLLSFASDPVAETITLLTAAGASVWLDLDDNLLHIPPAAWWRLGVADREVVDLPARDRQQERAKTAAARSVRRATGILASTPFLAETVRPLNPNVMLLPATIDPADIPVVPKPNDGMLRIGMAGTDTHNLDLPLVMPGLQAVSRRPDVEIHFWGCHPGFREGNAEGIREYEGITYVYHQAESSFRAYHAAIGEMDIMLAPLVDNEWNRAKSPVKWLDATVHGIALLCADLEPYAPAVDGVTCLKARTPEEYGRQLLRLVEDAPLRQRIGQAARQEVLAHHGPEAGRRAWRAVIEAAVGRAGTKVAQ